jgi:hypothetical protein
VKGNICLTECDIRWYKIYNYHLGRIPWYTEQVSQIINHVKEVGIPFVVSTPTIIAPVYTNCTDSFFFDWVTRAPSPVMMDKCFPERLDDDIDEEFDYDFINDGAVAVEYYSLFTPQQSTTEYAAAIQLATTPQSTNNPYRFHLEAYKHLINFAESDPKASLFLGPLLNDNLQKMVEFTTSRGLVETPVAEFPTTHTFAHRPTAVITSFRCPTSRKRKCKRLKRAGEYFKKKKYSPRGKDGTELYFCNFTSETGSHSFSFSKSNAYVICHCEIYTGR